MIQLPWSALLVVVFQAWHHQQVSEPYVDKLGHVAFCDLFINLVLIFS